MRTARQQRVIALRYGAFTIVEAVIVVFIIGVISAIALPRYAGLVAQQRAEAAARRIVADLAYAQRRARLTSTTQAVDFYVGDHSYYTLVGIADPDHPGQPYMVDLKKEPYSAVIYSVTLGADSEIVFDGYDRADSGGTVVIRVGAYQKTITVDPDTGRATVSSQSVIP